LLVAHHILYVSRVRVKELRTIFPLVLYGYENWSVTLKEEYGQKFFENKVKRKTFGSRIGERKGKLVKTEQ
jgi:hypothetical protein